MTELRSESLALPTFFCIIPAAVVASWVKSMATDLHLLHSYHRNGDGSAFRALMLAHAGMVFATARRITQDASLAEEVAQDTFLALAQRGQSIRESVAAWLYHIARQKACNVLRGELRRQQRESAAAMTMEVDKESAWAELEPHVDESLDELPEDRRALLIEHYFEQRTQQELATQRGLSQATVSRQLQEALQSLRDALRRRGVAAGAGLGALLSEHGAEAAPATLITALTKLAMSGVNHLAKHWLKQHGGTVDSGVQWINTLSFASPAEKAAVFAKLQQ
jgi:RNA polymerase sigma factor (sigma-70 family)